MPKFKVGDKIEFEMDGKKVSGTITRDYNSPDHAMYDVRVGAKTMTIADTPMRPANACKNAKFKVGDKVKWVDFPEDGIAVVKKVYPGNRGYYIEYKNRYTKTGKESYSVDEEDIVAANSRACNADEVKFTNPYYKAEDGMKLLETHFDMFDPKYAKAMIEDARRKGVKVPQKVMELARKAGIVFNSRNPIVAKALNACARNGIDDLNFDMKGVYEAARKLLRAGAKHLTGYKWSIPGDMEYGANIIASKVGGGVKRIQPDPNKAGFVIAEITDPLAQALERKGVMNACGTAKNAVTITSDSRKRDGWVTGKVNGYDFEAKVFDEGSEFGIKSGRVSKLWMRKGDETVNYDRGWDERPKSAEAKAAYTELLRKMESLPKVMNACGTARNYTRDTEAFRKRTELETQLNGIVQKFVNDIKAVGRKAASEYARLKKTDPEAFWVEEVTGWVDSLENAVDSAW